ncbi:hypothetical protein [Streptomyces luteolifulvus]|uniref:hypothetical protein n=1 Tax=Streptomyces luteolifulvus TaxID=2615112 RepID=UPI001CDA0BAB|nr:hypothetical protein [Streptomyces luteolifulvus]
MVGPTAHGRTTWRFAMVSARWTRALAWLAAAAEDPRACRYDWRRGSEAVHLLAAGRLWDVLIVPERLGLRAVGLLDDLPGAPGPMLLDGRGRRVGFFLPPDPAAIWVGPGTRYVTKGGWIAAPAPHCRWGTLRWLTPPDGAGTLNRPGILELALRRAMEELARDHGGSHHRRRPPRRSLFGPSAVRGTT